MAATCIMDSVLTTSEWSLWGSSYYSVDPNSCRVHFSWQLASFPPPKPSSLGDVAFEPQPRWSMTVGFYFPANRQWPSLSLRRSMIRRRNPRTSVVPSANAPRVLGHLIRHRWDIAPLAARHRSCPSDFQLLLTIIRSGPSRIRQGHSETSALITS